MECNVSRHFRLRILSIPLALLVASPVLAAPADDRAITEAAGKSLREFVEFLHIPNVREKSAADMRRNADWLVAAFKRHGLRSELMADGDIPWVFAEVPGASKAKKTVLFYAHMDGQAVFAKDWDQPDPFVPILKEKGADGKYAALSLDRLFEASPNPEWRVFARSSADDKAPIMMLMAAVDALKTAGKQPAINIKVIIDPREEGGPPTIKDVIARNLDRLKADAVAMLDGPMHPSNKPTIVFGNRGGSVFDLTVFASRYELHSGHYGNYAPNPVFGLGHLLASMKDVDGRVQIPGFYDGVDMTPAFKQVLAAVPEDEAALRERLGIAQSEKVGDNYQETLNYPTLNVTALKAGEPGSGRSIIPAFATASFDMRTVPGTPQPRQLGLIREWVKQQGYHLIDGETPTEQERRTYPRLAAITGSRGGEALMTPLDAPVGLWAQAALRKAFNAEPIRIPIMGGGVPSGPLADGLRIPILLIPLVNSDNNQHAANENLRVGNYFSGVKSLYHLLREPLPPGRN